MPEKKKKVYLKDDTYKLLKKEKKQDESFSDVVARLIKELI